MKSLLKIVYLVAVLMLLVYVSVSSPGFPEAPQGSLQSQEPADTETPLRRAYFTDLTREEVLAHYKNNFQSFPTLNLNYPPEEAQTIIRDQTRSSYLEELVHPLRESVYINGFVPKEQKDSILIDGKNYYQKITVKYVPSAILVRILYILAISALAYLLILRSTSFISTLVNYLTKNSLK